ncbi:MAG TPA: aminotransferase class I/II-fold pyridoxal phosphate-dependent enzyme [Spirochaetota bacterium]|nr:aminotransferase class I/II-fold pyridoxal phosphate-dependent enzyme [Spirochaetota bacterium]HPJ34346.1 aminotransferase class I/II-fold pyridoxal phosphate-dependent enzyme [Spirochaetota bacterium]
MKDKKYRFETLALHAGQEPDSSTGSRGAPVYRTSSYVFKDTGHAADLFALREPGNIYTRITNPTTDMLEKRITALEGGVASVAVASGTSAIHYTIINIASAGDEILAANNLYGGTYTMFDAILPSMGINCRFVNPADPENFRKGINHRTKLVYIETIGNPVLDFTDIRAVADIAHENGIPLVVDATFTTPYLLRTIEHGADIVINSLTKWIGGHGTAIGGSVTDSGKFNWNSEKFPLYKNPDPNYHGMRWGTDLPPEISSIPFAMRYRTVPLRNLGAALSPDNAWIFLQGTETLPLRMERHCENAMKVARFLDRDPRVSWVRYPGLPGDPSYGTASRYLEKGFGGMVVFGIKGGYSPAVKFIDNINLFSHVANVGDAKSLVIHPSSTSHSQLSEEQQRLSGLTSDLIRLSIGLEHPDDIIEALDEALDMSQK